MLAIIVFSEPPFSVPAYAQVDGTSATAAPLPPGPGTYSATFVGCGASIQGLYIYPGPGKVGGRLLLQPSPHVLAEAAYSMTAPTNETHQTGVFKQLQYRPHEVDDLGRGNFADTYTFVDADNYRMVEIDHYAGGAACQWDVTLKRVSPALEPTGAFAKMIAEAVALFPKPQPPDKQDGRLLAVPQENRIVFTLLAALRLDHNEYGGHRLSAIDALEKASHELQAATKYAADHNYASADSFTTWTPIMGMGSRTRPEGIRLVAEHVRTAIQNLGTDLRSYDGHRTRAIDQLTVAHKELLAAVDTISPATPISP